MSQKNSVEAVSQRTWLYKIRTPPKDANLPIIPDHHVPIREPHLYVVHYFIVFDIMIIIPPGPSKAAGLLWWFTITQVLYFWSNTSKSYVVCCVSVGSDGIGVNTWTLSTKTPNLPMRKSQRRKKLKGKRNFNWPMCRRSFQCKVILFISGT